MYEKDPCSVNDFIDGSGVNLDVGTTNTWRCSRTWGETRNEETPKDKDQDGTSRIHDD